MHRGWGLEGSHPWISFLFGGTGSERKQACFALHCIVFLLIVGAILQAREVSGWSKVRLGLEGLGGERAGEGGNKKKEKKNIDGGGR